MMLLFQGNRSLSSLRNLISKGTPLNKKKKARKHKGQTPAQYETESQNDDHEHNEMKKKTS